MQKRVKWGNPTIQVRVPKPLLRNVRAVARCYKAPVPVFVRDMLSATCAGDPKLAIEFQTRVARGMIEKRQRELSFDGGQEVLGRPGQDAKKGYEVIP